METSEKRATRRVGRAGVSLVGRIVGRLRVLRISGADNYGRRKWLCRCSCGNTVERLSISLTAGKDSSCGCVTKALAARNVVMYATPKTVKHGMSGRNKHPLYSSWTGMLSRCYNKNYEKYPLWGGIGIRVCTEWRKDFMAFYLWAIEAGWRRGYQLDRRRSSGWYTPTNCQWLSPSAHSRKTRREDDA